MSEKNHDRDGFLLGNEKNTSEDIFDSKKGEYLLMPGIPLEPKPAIKPSVIIAVIDSGIMKNHPQLRGLVIGEMDFTGEGPEDRRGHGTIVALLTLKPQYEVATEIKLESPPFGILNVKVAGADGRIDKINLIKAIEWAVQNGAKVVNLSLGFVGHPEEYEDLCQTIRSFKDVTFVCAAGNFGPFTKVYPANCLAENLISVGAVDEDGKAAGYSGIGDIYAKGTAVLARPAYYFYEEGNKAARKGKMKEAKELYARALREEELPQILFQLASIDIRENKLDNALDNLNRSIQIFPEFAEAHLHIGVIWSMRGNHSLAKDFFERSITIQPDNAMSHFNLGIAVLNLNQPNIAIKEFEKVYKIDPQYPRIQEMITKAKMLIKESKDII